MSRINFAQKIRSELLPHLEENMKGFKGDNKVTYRKARSKNDKQQRRILNRVKNSNR